MIAGIGTDLVDVKRIAEKLSRNPSFRDHVFSVREIDYCEQQKESAMHYAARWAVKEAYLKAYGVQFIGNHRLPEIETCHRENGQPFIQLYGKALQEFTEKNFVSIHLSITHTHELAMATVIIETDQ